jgi:16S rRNA (guanine527-N7)-methyltransferase
VSADWDGLLEPYADGAGLARLVRYAELLERWSPRHNLVRYATREELATRHIGDALAARPLLGSTRQLLDVGSGAGLPGVPLLAVSDTIEGCLLEPRHKRWVFLRTVVRDLGLEARVVRHRFQELATEERWDTITARAVGHHPELAAWARHHLVPDGQLLVWTGEDDALALRELPGWRVVSSELPGLARGRLVRLQPCFT